MSNEILSDITTIHSPIPLTTETIEEVLSNKYGGDIIRWAIVQVDIDNIKISLTYKKGHN